MKVLKIIHLLGAWVLIQACGTEKEPFRGSANVEQIPYNALKIVNEDPSFMQQFVQGDQETQGVLEEFYQGGAKGQLDLVVVVDDSGSMIEEQTRLSTRLASLVSHIEDTDWQIAITTTTVGKGCIELIDKYTPDPAKLFEETIRNQVDINGSSVEAGFYQALNVLQGQCKGQNWLRENSAIAVLVVSDEDNCGDFFSDSDSTCAGTHSRSEDWFWENAQLLRPAIDDYAPTVYGIINDPAAPCADAYQEAPVYKSVMQKTEGTFGRICALDYGPVLERISKDISDELSNQFQLGKEAEMDSIKILIDGKYVDPSEYEAITGNIVKFKNPPDQGTIIQIEYKTKSGTLMSSFKLQNKVFPKYLEVYLDGVKLPETGYKVDVATATVHFNQAPVAGTEIEIKYDPPKTAQTIIELPDGFQYEEEIKIYINEKKLEDGDYLYNQHLNTITVLVDVDEGVTIEIFYR